MHLRLPLSARPFRALGVALLASAAPLAKADTAPEPAPAPAPDLNRPHRWQRDLVVDAKKWKWKVYGDAVLVEGEMENKSPTETYRMIRLTAEVYDKKGRVLGQPSGSIGELGPGKTWKFKLFDAAGYQDGKTAKFIGLSAQ